MLDALKCVLIISSTHEEGSSQLLFTVIVINVGSRLFSKVNLLSSKHRVLKKSFETEVRLNNIKLPLNHFMQETLANMMIGLLKTLKETGKEEPASIEIRIKKLSREVEVDAHTYP